MLSLSRTRIVSWVIAVAADIAGHVVGGLDILVAPPVVPRHKRDPRRLDGERHTGPTPCGSLQPSVSPRLMVLRWLATSTPRFGQAILGRYRSACDIGSEWGPGIDTITGPGLVIAAGKDPYRTPRQCHRLAERTRATCSNSPTPATAGCSKFPSRSPRQRGRRCQSSTAAAVTSISAPPSSEATATVTVRRHARTQHFMATSRDCRRTRSRVPHAAVNGRSGPPPDPVGRASLRRPPSRPGASPSSQRPRAPPSALSSHAETGSRNNSARDTSTKAAPT
jgi:hypothetical protein